MNMDLSELPCKDDATASLGRFLYCSRQGLLKHAIPSRHNGYGNRFADLVEAHEALGRACQDTGLVLSINAHLWGALFPLLNFGSVEQQERYLNKLISGRLVGGHAITEPQAGSDLNALTMNAERCEEGFILNGRKRYITNTPIADMLVVYARLDNKLSAFIVHSDDDGANFLDYPQVSGCQTAPMGDVILENCRVADDRLLGKSGAGNLMIQQVLELERAFIFAGIAGVMEWQLDSAVEFSRERRINGAHLGRNQAISHKIADMKLRLDTIRLWVHECARLKDNNKRISLASAQTKLYAAEAFLQSSLDAVQIYGSCGLVTGSPMSELVGDALASRLFSGSSEVQKNIIAALLGTGEGFKVSNV
ncbi:acyl-CoA dehydrogenase family protein [Methylomarinum sp. Ch1-1]|uniref:Acyl-CoA dehydrogenase family protein n=1 Tax=Methylomarinum roseum TaxID=3067653 RepID=A0AAU7NYH9_9GAMM|nr:acyl-CoA dehydrogenase family protein [Methylomarinum sp. Ch1-1]MDP4522294.1 acyl-CoA dehydrogenase family protein [Methylomarinum sp. Ch1-1]